MKAARRKNALAVWTLVKFMRLLVARNRACVCTRARGNTGLLACMRDHNRSSQRTVECLRRLRHTSLTKSYTIIVQSRVIFVQKILKNGAPILPLGAQA